MRTFRLVLPLLFLIPSIASAQEPPSTQPSVPKGEVRKYTFDHSTIFPGTTRDYWIYVPRQYDGSKPACLFVDQDSVQFNAPAVFDRLIAAGEMPVTIGVFVQPGKVKASSPDALDRFNRSYEFDSLSDNYVRFLLEELLPDAEKQNAKDGRPIRISHDANDRAIGGSSSGAICAFTAAWERPDSFNRVFSAIGTYVDLRGGNIYPSLIRKFEPKPIRIFLQDGSTDHNHYGGDWWMANQEMERALVFAGYEVNHVWGTGGHNHKQADEIFPDAMLWLWKDYPAPVKKGLGSEQLQQILIPGEEWKLVGDGFKSADGPAANSKGEVFFSDPLSGKTFRIGPDGKPTAFIDDSTRRAGEAFGPDGRLYACASAANQIIAYDEAGHGTVIAEGIRGNDIVVRPDGGMYVTNDEKGADITKVWFITPKGEKKLVDSGLKLANGITMSPDQSLLYVDDMRSHWVYSYKIQPDGSLTDKQKFYDLYVPDAFDDSGADGMRVDRDGRLYVSTRAGIQVCDQAGRVVAIIPTPNGKISNLSFGGENLDVLYATCGEKVYARKLKVRGVQPYEAPIKPAPPKL